MSAIAAIPPVIDPVVQRRPELVAAIDEAMGYLATQLGPLGPPDVVRWSFADPGGEQIRLRMEDTGPEPRSAERTFWTRWLLDRAGRRTYILRVWGALLSKRSDHNQARIRAGIYQLLLEEEMDAGKNPV
ncbi:MAG: hypothetical protein ACRC7O_00495 [Fimbriiglobus sp.]